MKIFKVIMICFAATLVSCSKNDEDVSPPKTYQIRGAIIPDTGWEGEWLVTPWETAIEPPYLKCGVGGKVRTFVRQNGKTFDVGDANVKIDDKISGGSTGYIFYGFTIPQDINPSQAFETLVVHGVDNVWLANNTIACSNKLVRLTKGNRSCTFCSLGKTLYAAIKFATTYEILYIENQTREPITFRHKGFNTSERWYYTDATFCPEDQTVVGGSISNDVTSDIITVDAGQRGYITSIYIPNGKKISNAQLVAEINGREIYSVNFVNSDEVVKQGIPYFIYSIWDGEKLILGNNSN